MRARIDVSEIEAKTKIRAKYLRALENEEWSLLPGPTFVKSFLRTYATALDLDGKALVEEYRLSHERPSEGMLEPIVSPSQRNRNRGRGRSQPSGPSRGYTIAVGAIVLVIVVLIILLATGGSGKNSPTSATTTTPRKSTHHKAAAQVKHAPATGGLLSLSLTPTAAVYVCLIGENGRKLIPGLELQPGESTATYHARHFEITLGNNSVTMYIDGRARTVPTSTQAIGYSITKARGRQTLASAQLPTCK
jgi:cytoskeleton protein RodZ